MSSVLRATIGYWLQSFQDSFGTLEGKLTSQCVNSMMSFASTGCIRRCLSSSLSTVVLSIYRDGAHARHRRSVDLWGYDVQNTSCSSSSSRSTPITQKQSNIKT